MPVISALQLERFVNRMRSHVEAQTNRVYHDWKHHEQVWKEAQRLARENGMKLTPSELDVLEVAAHAHDAVYPGPDCEEESAELAVTTLKELGVADTDFHERVRKAIIRGTKHFSEKDEHQPVTRVEKLLHDADLAGIAGRYSTFRKDGANLQQESGRTSPDWAKTHSGVLNYLMKKHDGKMFETAYGRDVLRARARGNIVRLLAEYGEPLDAQAAKVIRAN